MYVTLHQVLTRNIHHSSKFIHTMRILIIAEHNNDALMSATQKSITAGKKIGGEVTVLLAGTKCSKVAKCLCTAEGLKRVLIAENAAFDGFPAENLTSLILATQKQFDFTHIVAGATGFGNAILPRVAAKLNVPAITNVVNVKGPDVFVRPIYAGTALMTLKTTDPVKVVTVRETSFEPCDQLDNSRLHSKLATIMQAITLHKVQSKKQSRNQMVQHLQLKRVSESVLQWITKKDQGAPVEKAPILKYTSLHKTFLKQNLVMFKEPKLSEAKVIICGGRGMQSEENFNLLFDLAKKMNAAVGASTAAVDEGFAPRDLLIGPNGTIVAPDLYIGVGVSGESHHVAGIKNSQTIVAINQDPKASIFKIANYGLVADLFKVIPNLIRKL